MRIIINNGDTHMKNNEYAIERITNELDGWYSNLEYYLTAWGGDSDPENVALWMQEA
jgi:hypothetical protein